MNLPIAEALPRLLAALDTHRNAVVEAPPGAGKSTGVPLALLDAPQLQGSRILMLEPRRLAARAVATRMATLLGQAVGQTVGYRTRLESRVSADTRIEVVTEGILTRRLQNDPELAGVGVVIFDEFHERSQHADLGLALCLEVQETLRDDLRLLVMSATLDGESVSRLLKGAPRISSAGRQFEVRTHYQHATPGRPAGYNDIAGPVARTVLRALETDPGDVLAFLPGQAEIRRAERLLLEALPGAGVRILPLYGDLAAAEQDAALTPGDPRQRKVVLATNIAETSLTIEGIRIVVDSGLARRSRFDPATGMSRLETVRISRASADQRRGRAGRLSTGVCYRLWTESGQAALAAQTPAEILEADLAPLALDLAQWGTSDPAALSWLDPPPAASLAQARDLLRGLKAIDAEGRITRHGREMAALGTHPRLAHLLLKAKAFQVPRLGAELAALLGERDLLRPRERDVDLRTRLDVLGRSGHLPPGVEVDHGARQRIRQTAALFLRQLNASDDRTGASAHEMAGMLLAFAYPDRIAQARSSTPGDPARYLLSGGRGACLQGAQTLSRAPYLVVAELDAGERDATIRLAAPLTAQQIETAFATVIRETERTVWDSRLGAVVATRERWLGALTLEERPLARPDAQLLGQAMLAGIRELGLAALPWTKAARALQARMEFARKADLHAPAPWPAVDEGSLLATLETWLLPWLEDITRREHLARLDLALVLRGLLDWPQQQRLDALAPTHLEVPSGSRLPIDYGDAGPVLAVRLQEVFGLLKTPLLGGGTVPVTLHLLSPARRPVQVTRDLKSFWERGYQEVKKELKGRYPKHYWPDDPLQAEPTARARPRK